MHCARPCGTCAEDIRLQPNLPIASERASPRHATLILLCACSVLPLSLFLPSLPAIARDLRADYALVALSLGGYAAVAASLEFVMGPLSDRFGRRPVVLASVGFSHDGARIARPRDSHRVRARSRRQQQPCEPGHRRALVR